MSQAFRDRRHFPAPMRWLRAGSDPSRSNHGHQCGERPLIRSKPASKCPLYAHDLARLHLRGPHPASVTSTPKLGAGIKSP
jgi:hypothetical protein